MAFESSPSARPSRRSFLAASGLLLAGSAAADEFRTVGVASRRVVRIRRDRDLLNVDLEFVNFRRVDQSLRSQHGSSYVVMHFPPQNLGEAIFSEKEDGKYEVVPLVDEGNAESNNPASPVRAYLAGPSRVVWAVPDGETFPWLGDAPDAGLVDRWLVQLARYGLRRPAILKDELFAPRPALADETSLELPYRLHIAPTSDRVRLLSSSERMPFDVRPAKEAVHELWNAQLMSRDKLDPAKPNHGFNDPNLTGFDEVTLQAKAFWSPDYRTSGEPTFPEYFPGKQMLSLRSLTRHSLVKQMSKANGWIDVDHLILTSIGADANLAYFNKFTPEEIIQYQLDNPDGSKALAEIEKKLKDRKELTDDEKKLLKSSPGDGTPLMAWKHRMVLGRDVYFVEAYFGVLFPMVYPALYIEVTQRKFASVDKGKDGIGPPGAFLLKRRYIVVRDPDRKFAGSDSAVGRGMPLKAVTLDRTKSPDLVDPTKNTLDNDFEPGQSLPIPPGLHFLPRALREPDQPLTWPLTMTDERGRQVATDKAYLLFSSDVNFGQVAWDKLRAKYRDWKMPRQELGLAPETATVKDEPGAPAVAIPQDDRDGVAAIGEALGRWQSTWASAEDQVNGVWRSLQGKGLAATRPYLARVNAALIELESQWKGSVAEWETVARQITSNVNATKADIDAIVKSHEAKLKAPADDIRNRIDAEAKRLESRLANVSAETVGKLEAVFRREVIAPENEIATEVQKRIDSIQTQFRDVTKVASAIAADTITFGSLLTDTYAKHFVGPLLEKFKITPHTVDNLRTHFDALKATAEIKKDRFASTLRRIEAEIAAIESTGNVAVARYVGELQRVANDLKAKGSHQFHAVLEKVAGTVPSMTAMLPDFPSQTFEHMPEFVAKGIDGVANGLFAKLNETALATNPKLQAVLGSANAAVQNGLGTPKTLIQGLSTQLGAVAAKDLDQLKQLADETQKEFQGYSDALKGTKLFGAIELVDLIGTIARGETPSINLVRTPESYTHTWTWTVPLKNVKNKVILPVLLTFDGPIAIRPNGSELAFHMSIVTHATLPQPAAAQAGARPTGTVTLDAYLGYWDAKTGTAKPPAEGAVIKENAAFQLIVANMVNVGFRQVRISSRTTIGETPKPKVKPDLVGVEFTGPLQFVMKLQQYLGNLGGGFKLSLTPKFIEMSYGFLIPPVSFGAFSIRCIQLRAGLMLPFADDPLRFSFGLSTFAVPFEMSVLCFGGRGFLRVEIDTKGDRTLEGALEFGGVFAFDCGVASGGVYVVAGIYFKATKTTTDLAGYLRAGGHIQVLGLIHVTVEFLLMVTYRKTDEGTELYGTCTITVSIEMLFFSISVGVTFEKKIAGSKEEKQSPAPAPVAKQMLAPPRHEPAQFISFGPEAECEREIETVAANEKAPRLERDRTFFKRHDGGADSLDGRYDETKGGDQRFLNDWRQFHREGA